MKNKKSQILESALLLYTQNNYWTISTIAIAKHAKVSEALIFKHFKNKRNLFLAVMTKLDEKITKSIEKNFDTEIGIKQIRSIIELPYNIEEENYPLWKLKMQTKWNTDFNNKSIWENIYPLLITSFETLNYKEPEKETATLLMTVEGLVNQILIHGKTSQLKYKYFLIHKYTLQHNIF